MLLNANKTRLQTSTHALAKPWLIEAWKWNKNNKGKKADRIVEVLEAEPVPDVDVEMKIDEDNMKSEDMAPETVVQETVEA